METLTWNEFKDSIKRIDCESCEKVKEGPKECEIDCINCYGEFSRWYQEHKDIIAIDELRKKILERGRIIADDFGKNKTENK